MIPALIVFIGAGRRASPSAGPMPPPHSRVGLPVTLITIAIGVWWMR